MARWAVPEAVLPPQGAGTGTALAAGDRATWRCATGAAGTGAAGPAARGVAALTAGEGIAGGGTGTDLPVFRWTTGERGGDDVLAAGGGTRGSRRSMDLYLSEWDGRGSPGAASAGW